MARYVIIGAGAVGAVLATQLTENGIDSVLVGRGEQIRRLREHGLTLVLHGQPRVVRIATAASPEEVALTGEDILVFATKTQDLELAARAWAWRPVHAVQPGDGSGIAVAADLPVLTLQNGLDAERILLRRFDRVIGGTIMTSAHYVRPGEVRCGALGPIGVLTIGAAGRVDNRHSSDAAGGAAPGADGGASLALERVAADLRRSGYIVQVTDDVSRWKAAKLLHSVRNGLEVLAGDDGPRAALGDLLVAEARAVLLAAGIDIADTVAERTEDLSAFRPDPASGIAPGQQSTWQSFARGASSEVDHLNGEVALLGRLHGVPTPANAALQRVLGEAERDSLGPGARTVEDVLVLLERSAPQPV